MADSAFKSAAFPSMTTARLAAYLQEVEERQTRAETNAAAIHDLNLIDKINAELERRQSVAAGDMSVMTEGERLRFVKTGKA